MLDIDIVIDTLKEKGKSIKKYGLPGWDLIDYLKK